MYKGLDYCVIYVGSVVVIVIVIIVVIIVVVIIIIIIIIAYRVWLVLVVLKCVQLYLQIILVPFLAYL